MNKNLIIIQFFLLILAKCIFCKDTYRVEHKINPLGGTLWSTVPVKLKEKANKINLYNSIFTKNVIYSNSTLKGNDAFVIDINCEIKNQNICNKVKHGFEKAAEKIAQIFDIYEGPITVNATFLSFCKLAHPDGSACNSNDPSRQRLGQGYPLSSYPAKAVNPEDGDTDIYLYPQALLRQLDTINEPEYSQYDIAAEFNSDIDWYFEEDGEKISDGQHDFVYVAAHEFIHGLGFISSWRNILDTDQPYLTPRSKVGISHNQEVVVGWHQFQIFDKYITINDTQVSLKDMGKKIMNYENTGKIIRQDTWLSGFFSSKEGLVAKEVYKIATSGEKVFTFVSNRDKFKTYLQTYRNFFISGTCMGHLDDNSYRGTPDFLLIPYVSDGVTLEEKIEKYTFSYVTEEEKEEKDLWSKSILGPHILSIMEAIGWPTKYNNVRRTVEVISFSIASHSINRFTQIILSTFLILIFV